MKIYTKRGDQGSTDLIGGRVQKNNLQVELYGQLDELISMIGYGRGLLLENTDFQKELHILIKIQGYLMDISAELAHLEIQINPKFIHEYTQFLEGEIDKLSLTFKHPNAFIIPGASKESGWIDYTRSKVRTIERLFIATENEIPVVAQYFSFLNRLSDFFYVLARAINSKQQVDEIIYKKNE